MVPGGRSLPGIVFVHDVWGPSPHSEQFSDRLADAGHAVLAVDFYRDLEERPGGDPGAFIRALDDTRVLADVAAGVASLAARPECAEAKIGLTGVCMGGMYTLLAACSVDGLSAAAPFYGMLSYETGMLAEPGGRDLARKPRSPLEAAPDLRCPLLAFFGEQDTFIPAPDVEALRAALTGAGPASEIVTYPGAGHAFMNETRPEAFNPGAAADAWTRLVEFFARHLG
jgi:carboxymethylenebutenolidase